MITEGSYCYLRGHDAAQRTVSSAWMMGRGDQQVQSLARDLQGSVLGSYLDPLADKVLMISTVGALAYQVLVMPACLSGGWASARSSCVPKLAPGTSSAQSHLCLGSLGLWLSNVRGNL